ncbi:tail fiber assembly protein [Enterobacter roggenkampii]|uniref:tail fiber assembly protein n=1 Tax=Enterobacter roggenkampii TaxID=1812935 RepID=UPI001E2F7F20|nr:tail fiber assembly protein [Enterobacter roggenkampii]MCC7581571.1 tail fiber assembly protein [Enterobacter roggenkampii]MCC7591249.1 tail fiber assembly protein [Enterobacter roggenkampii]MCC7595532.1 tail fiber assembly protein [Enterobacter roggenkampii]MCC7605079.1 tail fiber assembly protein [Enterobacter roggenkampii]MCC7610150.1 tail fiber assembly protein [Enterobacter roggenkampii]
MIKRYALVKNGVVENLVSWNGEGELFSEFVTVELNDDSVASVGWSYNGKEFTPPPEPEKTHAELVVEADAEKQSRLDYATTRIVVWQTKLMMGRKLTTDETAALNAWMDYIDAVTAIDTSTAPDITWPNQPEM